MGIDEKREGEGKEEYLTLFWRMHEGEEEAKIALLSLLTKEGSGLAKRGDSERATAPLKFIPPSLEPKGRGIKGIGYVDWKLGKRGVDSRLRGNDGSVTDSSLHSER